MPRTSPHIHYDAIVCGAGIAGIAAAEALVQAGVKRVAIVDPGPPLSLTSDKSTECYRNWWPGPGTAMVDFMSRTIELLESHARASGNRIGLNRRGYLFATARPEVAADYERQAIEAEALGVGPLRRHARGSTTYQPAAPDGYDSTLDGADLILDPALIQQHFPYLNVDTIAVLHARRCGFLDAQQLGMHLLERARDGGATLIKAAFTGAETEGGRIRHVYLETGDGAAMTLSTDALVLATGPYLNAGLDALGLTLPVVVEKHVKISVPDPLGAMPRRAPLVIWSDPVHLPWSAEERAALAETDETRFLLDAFPAGVHGRPTGKGDQVLMYWTYDCPQSRHPSFPIDWHDMLPEITFRGMAVLIPGLTAYLDAMPRPYIDGGYYTKTPENRPLIGPLAVPGAYVCSAFSGYGIMAACAAGELLAAHLTGATLPTYAPAFLPSRFDDPAYLTAFADADAAGQL